MGLTNGTTTFHGSESMIFNAARDPGRFFLGSEARGWRSSAHLQASGPKNKSRSRCLGFSTAAVPRSQAVPSHEQIADQRTPESMETHGGSKTCKHTKWFTYTSLHRVGFLSQDDQDGLGSEVYPLALLQRIRGQRKVIRLVSGCVRHPW